MDTMDNEDTQAVETATAPAETGEASTAAVSDDEGLALAPGITLDTLALAEPPADPPKEQQAAQAAEEDGEDDKAAKKRIINLSYASPEWMDGGFFGKLRLNVGRKNVVQRRISLGKMSFLADHDGSKPIGRVISGKIGQDGVAYATVEMADTPRAREYLAEIDAGIRSGTSPGFIVHEARALREEDDEYDSKEFMQIDITRWEPYEISSTPIPKNPSVGLLSASLDGEKMLLLSNGGLIMAGVGKLESAIASEIEHRRKREAAAMDEEKDKEKKDKSMEEDKEKKDKEMKDKSMEEDKEKKDKEMKDKSAFESLQTDVASLQSQAASNEAKMKTQEDHNEIMRLGLQYEAGQDALEHIKAGGDPTAFPG